MSANIPTEVRHELLTSLLTTARLIRHVHFRIANETSRFMESGKPAEAKYKQMDEYRDLLNRVALYLDLLLSNGALVNAPDTKNKVFEIAREVKRIQIEIA